MKPHLIALLFVLSFTAALPQAKTRRLPSIINHPSLNLYAPFISADGNALLFLSNGGQDGALAWMYTWRENDWVEPVEIPKHLNTRLNYIRGYALSADGRRLYYSSAKSPVVGGYDIFAADLKPNNTWGEPQNLMAPINSKANESCPSVTPDGNMMFFTRCDKMDMQNISGCKIFMSRKKPSGQWEEPVELPANINTGNSQAPRIMADGETLIFASDKNGGKGGMDLFLTRFRNGSWTSPEALDFINSDANDTYVSVAALGRYLLKESRGNRGNLEITEFLIPEGQRPKGLMKLEGKVMDNAGKAAAAYLTVTDLSTSKRVYSGRPAADGSYFVYLREGTRYEVSFDPELSNISFYSKVVDLTTDKTPQKEKLNVTLKQPLAGDEFVLGQVKFKPGTSDLDPASENELKKLARMAKANAALKFEIQVMLQGYIEDAQPSQPDLTEMVVDSVRLKVNVTDATGATTQQDSVTVKTLYHNDRTARQAATVVTYLQQQGVTNKLTVFNNAIPATTEGPKTIVKVIVR